MLDIGPEWKVFGDIETADAPLVQAKEIKKIVNMIALIVLK